MRCPICKRPPNDITLSPGQGACECYKFNKRAATGEHSSYCPVYLANLSPKTKGEVQMSECEICHWPYWHKDTPPPWCDCPPKPSAPDMSGFVVVDASTPEKHDAYFKPEAPASAKEWTLVIRGDPRAPNSWRWDVTGPMGTEFHDDVHVIEYSAYEKLERELAEAKRDFADAVSGCCDCPIFKAESRRSDALIEDLRKINWAMINGNNKSAEAILLEALTKWGSK